MPTGKADPLLWQRQPKFGVAGGADEIVLTDYGRVRAFVVATGVDVGFALPLLTELRAYGAAGTPTVHTQAGSRLAALGLARNDNGRDFISAKGEQLLTLYYAEVEALLERIKREQAFELA